MRQVLLQIAAKGLEIGAKQLHAGTGITKRKRTTLSLIALNNKGKNFYKKQNKMNINKNIRKKPYLENI